MAKNKRDQKPRSSEQQAIVVGNYGAHLQLDPRAHRPRRSPNKRAEQKKRACRDWR